MFRRWLARVGIVALVAASFLMIPATASARWGGGWGGYGRGGWGGYYGGYYGGYWPGSYSYYRSYPSYGSYYPYSSSYYYPSYGSYSYPYSSGYYYPSYSYSYTYPRSSYSYSTPSTYYEPSYGSSTRSGRSYYSGDEHKARVKVNLARSDAEVTINGHPTRQKGAHRTFVSPELSRKETFKARIVARWKEGGAEVVSSKTVRLHPGDRMTVDLTQPTATDNNRRERSDRSNRSERSDRSDQNDVMPEVE